MKPFACGILLSLLSQWASADVEPFLERKQLGVVITGIKYSETLPKDLKSGLTNRVLIRVTLLANSQALAQKSIEVSVKYDLWDEKFLVTMGSGSAVATTSTYATVHDVMAYLARLKLTDLFAVTELAGLRELSLRAELLVNPIERERMDKIQKWVTENSTYTPMSAAGGGGPTAVSRSNELFNQIFAQYSAGAEVAAAWQKTESSQPFKWQDLVDEQ